VHLVDAAVGMHSAIPCWETIVPRLLHTVEQHVIAFGLKQNVCGGNLGNGCSEQLQKLLLQCHAGLKK